MCLGARDAFDPWWLTAGPRRPRYVRADNAYVAGCCPGPRRGLQRWQNPMLSRPPWRTRYSPTTGCVCIGASVARRPVVFISISSGRRAGHVPSSDEVRGRDLASRFSRLQDAPSACQQAQRVLPFGGLPGRGRTGTVSRRTETASSSVTWCSSTTICVTHFQAGV